jgi:hypothetical protein
MTRNVDAVYAADAADAADAATMIAYSPRLVSETHEIHVRACGVDTHALGEGDCDEACGLGVQGGVWDAAIARGIYHAEEDAGDGRIKWVGDLRDN